MSMSGNGLPDSYNGAVETINPNDADIVWNSTLSVWEVSFDVTGFSGFFVKTQEATLPVAFGNVQAAITNNVLKVSWQTLSEHNNQHFDIQISEDGKAFTTIKRIQSMAPEGNRQSVLNYEYAVPLHSLAQVGIAAALFLVAIGYSRRRLLWITVVLVAGCSVFFIACSKSADGTMGTDEVFFVRVAHVDKDGSTAYSKVVKTTIK